MRRIQSIKAGQEVIGNRTRVRVVKNKVAPPFRTVEFDIMYNEGISKSGDLLDLAVDMEIIDKRGSYYSYGDTRLGQGRENTKESLRSNLELSDEINEIIRSELLGEQSPPPQVSKEDDTIEDNPEEEELGEMEGELELETQ